MMKDKQTFELILTIVVFIGFALSTTACSPGCEPPWKEASGVKTAIPPNLDTLEFPVAVKTILRRSKWQTHRGFVTPEIPPTGDDYVRYVDFKGDRETYLRTLELGTRFLVQFQFEAGNFRYQYDWLERTWTAGDNQVRQAGTLWGVALCHQFKPTPETRAALERGFEFWFTRTVPGPDGSLTVAYPRESKTKSGTVALLALAIIEYLRTEKALDPIASKRLRRYLDGYVKFLTALQLPSGRFATHYHLKRKRRGRDSSPYSDGEILLCLVKAARYLGYTGLVPVIEVSARAAATLYTVTAWAKERDSALTKGFYQWGSMALTEYYFAKWKDFELYGDVVLTLAHWMIHTHEVSRRKRNTSYALEGLISAYRIARDRGLEDAAVDILFVVDRVMYKLTTWQIGGPLSHENPFLADHPTDDPWALGGMMNSARPVRNPKPSSTYHELRADVTQHHIHAVILGLNHLYR